MESSPENLPAEAANACIACKSPEFDRSYKTALCDACRKNLTQLVAPLWVKALAVIVIALVIAGIVMMPKSFRVAVQQERAEDAWEEKRFFTAAKSYELVVAAYPRVTENKVRLFHAYFMNGDFEKALPLIDQFSGARTEDMELLNLSNSDFKQLELFLGDTAVNALFDTYTTDTSLIPVLWQYALSHPESQAALFFLADRLYDQHRFRESDSLASKVLAVNPEFPGLLGLLGAICRETRQYDRAIAYYDQQLDGNAESIQALTGKARVELKRGNDGIAAELTETAKALDPADPLVKEAELLLLYLSGKTKEARAVLEALRQSPNPADSAVYERNRLVVSGETKYR